MCRAGGRRCPGCHGETARAAHNARRRRNRELKKEIIEQAEAVGLATPLLDDLRNAPPEKVKRWAAENGFSERFHPGKGHEDPAEPEKPARAPARPRMPSPAVGVPVAPTPEPAPPADGPIRVPGVGLATPELDDQIRAAVSRTGTHRDERSMAKGSMLSSTRAPGGSNETSRVVLDNGMVGFHKPFDGVDDSTAGFYGHDSPQQQIHEVAAWLVAREMGEPWKQLVPPVILREVGGRLGSFAMERGGVGRRHPDEVEVSDRHAAAFFDALIGQQDRHPNNYLVAGDRVSLIDHGYSFARGGDFLNHSFFQSSRCADPSALLLKGSEVDALDRFLASADSWGLEGVLEPERLEAMRWRASEMRTTGRILPAGILGENTR